MTTHPNTKPARELLEEALAAIPSNLGALGVAQHLAARGCRGAQRDGRHDALAMHLEARVGFPVHVRATTVTALEPFDSTGLNPREDELFDVELPDHVRRFVRYLGRGFYPELVGDPSAGTTGPLSAIRCANRRR